MAATMNQPTAPWQTSGPIATAGPLMHHLHEEAMHQQHVLDTWQFAAAMAGKHRTDTPRLSRAWVGADHQGERPALVALDEAEEAAGIPLPSEAARSHRIRRFLDGAGEPETLNTRTEFTGH